MSRDLPALLSGMLSNVLTAQMQTSETPTNKGGSVVPEPTQIRSPGYLAFFSNWV